MELFVQDPNAPKRPMSAYFLFMNATRPQVILTPSSELLPHDDAEGEEGEPGREHRGGGEDHGQDVGGD